MKREASLKLVIGGGVDDHHVETPGEIPHQLAELLAGEHLTDVDGTPAARYDRETTPQCASNIDSSSSVLPEIKSVIPCVCGMPT